MAHGHAGDAPLPPGYYPPTFSDPYTGEPAQVIRRTIKIDGPPPSRPSQIHSTKGGPGIHAHVKDTLEKYDCVIVGAGASGISAAKWYQHRFGPDTRTHARPATRRARGPTARTSLLRLALSS